MDQSGLNNHSNQLNPNNNSYWRSRGYDSRPDNWNSSMGDQSTSTNSGGALSTLGTVISIIGFTVQAVGLYRQIKGNSNNNNK